MRSKLDTQKVLKPLLLLPATITTQGDAAFCRFAVRYTQYHTKELHSLSIDTPLLQVSLGHSTVN